MGLALAHTDMALIRPPEAGYARQNPKVITRRTRDQQFVPGTFPPQIVERPPPPAEMVLPLRRMHG